MQATSLTMELESKAVIEGDQASMELEMTNTVNFANRVVKHSTPANNLQPKKNAFGQDVQPRRIRLIFSDILIF